MFNNHAVQKISHRGGHSKEMGRGVGWWGGGAAAAMSANSADIGRKVSTYSGVSVKL
eukprot:SAG31_NODE_3876_length_3792_cov_1.788248_2_plen_57_part_00